MHSIQPLKVDELFNSLSPQDDSPPALKEKKTIPHRRIPDLDDLYRVCSDGERTAQLTKIAGTLISMRVPIDKVVQHAQNWNRKNTPPLNEEAVEKTCRSIQRTHDRNNIEPSSHTPEDKVQPLFQLQEASISRFIGREPTPRRWLIKDSLPVGKVGMLVAPGGSSKSQLALQLAASVVTGLSLAEAWEIDQTGAALCLFAEDDDEEIHRRLHVLLTNLPFEQQARLVKELADKLFIKSMVGLDNLLTKTDSDGEVRQTPYVERLLATIDGLPDLRLIVLDPASRFRGGQENANEDATRFVEALEFVAQRTGANILVLHHTNKGSINSDEQSQTAARGASALTDGVRWQKNLRTITTREATALHISEDIRRQYLFAEVTKNNYGPPAAPMLLQRRDGGYLARATLAHIQPPERTGLRVLRALADLDVPISAKAFEERHAGKDTLGIGKVRVRQEIKTLLSDGLLEKGRKSALSLTAKGLSYLSEERDARQV